MVDLLFVCDRTSGLFASLVEGLSCLVIVHPQAFSRKNRGVEPCHIFLVGQTMVLGEMLSGQFEWGPSSHSRGSFMGPLVTNFRFLMASPYSSQVRSTGPEGSSPFFEEKTWTVRGQDSNVG
jgi:hypothetical protein